MILRSLSLVLAAGLALSAGNPNRTETRTEALPMGAKLWIKQGDGKVDVQGWDRAEVQLTAEFKEGSNHGEAKLDVRRVTGGLEIEVERPHSRHFHFLTFGEWRQPVVDLTLKVPRRLIMDVRSVDGKIVVEDLEGYAGCHSVDGSIFLKNITGEAHVGAVDGSISVHNLNARIKGGTVDGNISLDQVAGGVDLHTVDGNITADQLDGWGEGLAFRTVDGTIRVKLGQAKGNLEAKSVDGTIRSRIPGLACAGNKTNRLTGSIPGRDQRISLHTVGGAIEVE
jgi:DUF4097 and DUF4098 domain-containing protein YvlB